MKEPGIKAKYIKPYTVNKEDFDFSGKLKNRSDKNEKKVYKNSRDIFSLCYSFLFSNKFLGQID